MQLAGRSGGRMKVEEGHAGKVVERPSDVGQVEKHANVGKSRTTK